MRPTRIALGAFLVVISFSVAPTTVQSAGVGATIAQLNPLLIQFKGHSSDETLRKQIITLVLTMPTPPPIPPDALAADGRGQYIFKGAKSEDDYLGAAKAYLQAIEIAPWAPAYYYNLGVILEKTSFTGQALHAYKLYLVASPQANDAADVRKKIAGLQYALQQSSALHRAYTGDINSDDLYRVGGVSQTIDGKDIAVKLVVATQGAPQYQLNLTCFETSGIYSQTEPLAQTDTSVSMCSDRTQMHIIVSPSGDGFVQISAGNDTLHTTIQALFQARRDTFSRSPVWEKLDKNASPPRYRFFVTMPQGGDAARWIMYESSCSGTLLNDDLRALPADIVNGAGALNTFEYERNPHACDTTFALRTGYDWYFPGDQFGR